PYTSPARGRTPGQARSRRAGRRPGRCRAAHRPPTTVASAVSPRTLSSAEAALHQFPALLLRTTLFRLYAGPRGSYDRAGRPGRGLSRGGERVVSMSVGDLTALRIALLGLVSADRDGQPLPIGPPRRRAVLAVLAPCRH